MPLVNILLAVGAAGAISGLALGSNMFAAIIGEVNGREPAARRLSYAGANRKLFLVLARHKQHFPESKLRLAMWCFIGAGFFLAAVTLATALIRANSS